MFIGAVIAIVSTGLLPDPEPKPAAMVLAVRGAVEVRPVRGAPHPAAPKDLLYAADRLKVPAEGEVTLIYLGEGSRERVKPGAEVMIGAAGGAPAGSVERLKPVPPAVSDALRVVRPVAGGGRIAAASFRSDAGGAERRPGLTPIDGASVLTDRPALAWPPPPPPAPGVEAYRVALRIGGSNRLLWSATTPEPRLAYPDDQRPLRRGRSYSWTVSDPKGATIAEGHFSVVTEEEFQSLAEVGTMARSTDPGDLLLAAMAFEAHGVCDAALAAYERLIAQSPDEPTFRAARDELRARAGIAEQGQRKP
jgi:hypothetical protein